MTDDTDRYSLGLTNEPTVYDGQYEEGSPFPWRADRIEEYTAYRIDEPIAIDGHLDEPLHAAYRGGNEYRVEGGGISRGERLSWVDGPFVTSKCAGAES